MRHNILVDFPAFPEGYIRFEELWRVRDGTAKGKIVDVVGSIIGGPCSLVCAFYRWLLARRGVLPCRQELSDSRNEWTILHSYRIDDSCCAWRNPIWCNVVSWLEKRKHRKKLTG